MVHRNLNRLLITGYMWTRELKQVAHCCTCDTQESKQVAPCCTCDTQESKQVAHCCTCGTHEFKQVAHCCTCDTQESKHVAHCCTCGTQEFKQVAYCCTVYMYTVCAVTRSHFLYTCNKIVRTTYSLSVTIDYCCVRHRLCTYRYVLVKCKC